ncbi:type II secretion system protein [Virgibacillus sp. W0430]|uniref:type II secretion system protein n=1 Tax=Virgibacillus sp. W0430 TaxID=3391580 RepID=UPI003F462BBD
MYSKKKEKNSVGFTLVELIVSITLISIVIVVLLPMFPQLLNWSKQTNEELVSSNLLDQFVFDLKNDESLRAYVDNSPNVANCEQSETPYALDEGYTTTVDNQRFKPTLTFCQTEREKELNLYRGNVHVFANGEDLKNTYFYMTAAGDADE